MSKGPGRIENAVQVAMPRLTRPTTSQLAASVYDVPEVELTRSQLGSVRRALRRLAERGIVEAEVPPIGIVWKLVGRRSPTADAGAAKIAFKGAGARKSGRPYQTPRDPRRPSGGL